MLNSIPPQLGAQPAEFVGRDPLGAVRLLVFASALHYSAVGPHLLSNHVVNTAYVLRDRITLTEFEKNHLFTSMIREGNRYTPGWFWVRDGGSVGVLERLYTLATGDRDPDTRRAAVAYLTQQRNLETSRLPPDDVALTFLQDNSEDVKRAAVEYAATRGSDALIQKLEELRSDDPTLAKATDAAVAMIKVRTNPQTEVPELLRRGTEPVGVVVEALRGAARELDEASLYKALKHGHPDVRHVGATAMLERGLISENTAKELVKDDSRDVVAVGIQTLIERGEAPSAERIRELLGGPDAASLTSLRERDELVLKSLAKLTSEELKRHVGWLSVDGPAAYEVMGKREFGKQASDIRRDLETRFAGLKQRNIEALGKAILASVIEGLGSGADEATKAAAEAAAESALEKHVGQSTELDGFVKGRFAVAGLRVLGELGDRRDVELVRVYAESEVEEVRSVVVELLRKWGDGSDVNRLIAISTASIVGATSEKAGRAAIELSDSPRQLVGRFLCSESPSLAEAALEILEADKSLELPEECEQLLASDSQRVRLGLAGILVERWNQNSLRSLLDRYINRGTYYYDVVTDLDRALYSPEAEGVGVEDKREG